MWPPPAPLPSGSWAGAGRITSFIARTETSEVTDSRDEKYTAVKTAEWSDYEIQRIRKHGPDRFGDVPRHLGHRRIRLGQAAIEEGINFFDTAPAYNAGAAERLLGEAVKKSGRRNELILATKCGTDLINGQYVRDASRAKIMDQIDKSLANLQTDYIDIYLLHWPSENVPEEEAIEAMADIRKSGKVRFIGVSNHSIEQRKAAEKVARIDCVQMQYSMLVQENTEALKAAHEDGLGTMLYGPLGGGILTGRYRELKEYGEMDNRNRFYKYFKEPGFSKAMKLLETLDKVAAERHVPLSEIAINWAAQKEFASSVLVGTQKAERVYENCRALDWMLSDEEIALLDKAAAEL